MLHQSTANMNQRNNRIDEMIETGRKNVMSLLNLNLNFSYFDIDIQIKQNEEKKKDKMRKAAEHEMRLNHVLEDRRNDEYKYMIYHLVRY
ncbi:MAG: hypothetical protein ACOYVK_13280 [Bacillota bacterium]